MPAILQAVAAGGQTIQTAPRGAFFAEGLAQCLEHGARLRRCSNYSRTKRLAGPGGWD